MVSNFDKLVDSFDYFDALFHNTKENCVLLMNADGIITHINSSFSNFFGYEKEDITGKHCRILFTEHDEKAGRAEIEITTVLTTGQCYDNNYLVHKNGTITWVSGESILVKNKEGKASILKLVQDIHEQKASQKSLEQSNEFNENILSSIDDIVIVLSEKMEIVKTNNAFNNLFKNETSGNASNFTDIIRPYDLKNVLTFNIQQVFEKDTPVSINEIEIEAPGADKKLFNISCQPMESVAGIKNVLLILHDVTIQKNSEKLREDIIGFVAHELRNPLANLILCNELISESIKENNTEESIELLTKSQNNVMRLNKIIADLYDATKISSGNLQLEISNFNFEDMIREAIDTLNVLQPFYNITVEGDADISVDGDRHRLIQVVTNYLSNGIKYSGGNTEVFLNMKYNENNITVSVKDAGLGIKEDQLPYIFNRYFRADKTKKLEGIGLGLYLCSQIVKAHKGNIWAESKEGKGSTFYFSIPR